MQEKRTTAVQEKTTLPTVPEDSDKDPLEEEDPAVFEEKMQGLIKGLLGDLVANGGLSADDELTQKYLSESGAGLLSAGACENGLSASDLLRHPAGGTKNGWSPEDLPMTAEELKFFHLKKHYALH